MLTEGVHECKFYQLADVSKGQRVIPFCLCRRTKTNTTAQRPYQGGFTIGNKLNNVSQISSNKVLKFVGMKKTVMGGSCLTVVWALAAQSEAVGSISVLASYHNAFVSSNVEWRHESRMLELKMEVSIIVQLSLLLPTVLLTLSWGFYLLFIPIYRTKHWIRS